MRWYQAVYRVMYRLGLPVWQRSAPPADLVALVEGPAALPAGRALELGCGTGRLTIPVARAGAEIVGIDRSEPMLTRARQRLRRSRASALLVRGDIRHLPFRRRLRFCCSR